MALFREKLKNINKISQRYSAVAFSSNRKCVEVTV